MSFARLSLNGGLFRCERCCAWGGVIIGRLCVDCYDAEEKAAEARRAEGEVLLRTIREAARRRWFGLT